MAIYFYCCFGGRDGDGVLWAAGFIAGLARAVLRGLSGALLHKFVDDMTPLPSAGEKNQTGTGPAHDLPCGFPFGGFIAVNLAAAADGFVFAVRTAGKTF